MAILVATLAVALCAASTAGAAVRTEFYGIVQGILDPTDRAGIADVKVQTDRFMLKWRACLRGDPVAPVHIRLTVVGGQRRARASPNRQLGRDQCVDGIPQDGG